MNTIKASIATLCAATSLVASGLAQSDSASPAPAPKAGAASTGSQPSAEEMQKMMNQMMELAKLNENHQLLADLAGNWDYTVKMWMAPGAPPIETIGSAVRKPIMNGRYFVADFNGEMKMPGPDGKMKTMPFIGKSLDGYDNVKKKFVSAWTDNMGTGIMVLEGTYDPATKTFTYNSEIEMMPGMKSKVREVIKVVDKDHHTLEWYENQGGQEVKSMEIDYTRK